MQVVGYEFKEGVVFQAKAIADADLVGKRLEWLRQECKNELTPQDVVNDARSNNSPLHSFFEWDDGAAAEKYRLDQARGLIRSVVAIYRCADEPERKIQAFVHIPEAGAPHYRSTEHALSQEKTREMVLRQAWKEFQSWRKRYEHLDAFADVFRQAEKVQEKLKL